MNWRQLIWMPSCLVLAGSLLGAGFNALRPSGLRWDGTGIPAIDAEREAAEIIPGVERSQDEATLLRHLRDGTATIIDARSTTDFDRQHLLGAVSIPADQLNEATAGRIYTHILPGMPAIILCNRPGCPSGNRVAKYLLRHGVIGLQLFVPGWERVQHLSLPFAVGPWQP